jgi:hypothetical protein
LLYACRVNMTQQTMTAPAPRRLRLKTPVGIPSRKPAAAAFEPPDPAPMLLAESALAKDWDTPEEDAAWQTL